MAYRAQDYRVNFDPYRYQGPEGPGAIMWSPDLQEKVAANDAARRTAANSHYDDSTLKNIHKAIGIGVPAAAGLVPTLSGLFSGGGAAAVGGATQAAAPAATGGKLATLGKLFTGRGLELGVNSALTLFGMKSGQKAADQARRDQLLATQQALALERQRLEIESQNANLDREDARALNAAINELKKRELDAAEEARAWERNTYEQQDARREPYRQASQQALNKLLGMWGA